MTVIRKELHCLPVKARIQFKIVTLTWKAYHNIGPKYLSELLQKRQGLYNTRSIDDYMLDIPVTKLVTCGDRSFQKAAPTL